MYVNNLLRKKGLKLYKKILQYIPDNHKSVINRTVKISSI